MKKTEGQKSRDTVPLTSAAAVLSTPIPIYSTYSLLNVQGIAPETSVSRKQDISCPVFILNSLKVISS